MVTEKIIWYSNFPLFEGITHMLPNTGHQILSWSLSTNFLSSQKEKKRKVDKYTFQDLINIKTISDRRILSSFFNGYLFKIFLEIEIIRTILKGSDKLTLQGKKF